MTLSQSVKKTFVTFIDNQADHTQIHIPGWALNWNPNQSLKSDSNHCFIHPYDPNELINEFPKIINEYQITKLSFIGFSMGAWMACSICQKYNIIPTSLLLQSCATQFQNDNINKLLFSINQNQSTTLKHFYHQCFSIKTEAKLFIKDYGQNLINTISKKTLKNGLLFLKSQSLNKLWPHHLKKISTNIKFQHGIYDEIAPLM